jgi:hypothetical protein
LVEGLTYDSGALIAAERGQHALWKLHDDAVHCGHTPTVPAGVLGQVWRGGPQARLSRLLRDCQVEVLDEVCARSAGVACGQSHTSDVIDATVVVGAARRGDVVVTSDPDDIHHLATAFGLRVQLIVV